MTAFQAFKTNLIPGNKLLALLLTALLLLTLACPARAADTEEAQYNVVAALYNAGQWEAAIKKIEEREKLELPNAARSRYLFAKGLAYEKGQKPDQARAAYDQLLTKFPAAAESVPARTAMIYIDYAAGKSDAVIAGYAKVDQTKLTPADKKNLSLMNAESLFATKPDKVALDAYKAAIAAGNDAAAVSGKLFDLYVRLGMHAEVIAQSATPVPGIPGDRLALIRAESLLALSRWPEAEAEAKKVDRKSDQYPRAAFAQAQALLKQNKLKDAAAPLEDAIDGMKNPAAPPAAYLALAECYLESNRAGDVEKALHGAEKAARSGPEDQKAKVHGQSALLRIRAAVAGKDRKETIRAITDARADIPKDQLGKLLYMRLFALSEEGDAKAVLKTMADDYPVFQAGEEYGPATLIYCKALTQTKQADQAATLLEELIAKKPASAEALRARLELANAALEKGDHAKAKTLFDAIAATPGSNEKLGKNAFDELQFNRGVVAQKLGDNAAAITAFAALLAGKPSDEITKQAQPLLGQAYAVQKDYANAAATWKAALASGKVADEADLRDRLARVLYASKDYAGAVEQLTAEAKLVGGENKLARESREVWARSLFAAGKFADAAAMYASLAESFRGNPGYLYETAVAWERAGKPADAEKWYSLAQQQKDKLPAEYAAAVDGNLAALRLSSGAGDMGLSDWLTRLENAKDDAAFESAAAALRKIAVAGKIDTAGRARLTKLMDAAPADKAHHYALGALMLQSQWASGAVKDTGKLAATLAAAFAEHEKTLDAKSSGATLAPAVIYFVKGESERSAGNVAEALASYETVLSAYPFNEWPDAAACGAAECYAAIGDKDTAIAKLKEVIASKEPASAHWREVATKRAAEIEKGS